VGRSVDVLDRWLGLETGSAVQVCQVGDRPERFLNLHISNNKSIYRSNSDSKIN
jgi:hypothetical protein